MDTEDMLRDFGYNLKVVLRECRMTQQELADILDIDKSTMSRYIRGECMPSLKIILNIMYATDCVFEDLVSRITHVD